jgi:hypothetical protein
MFILKNKEGNKFFTFMNVFFLLVSSSILYVSERSFYDIFNQNLWIKFNMIFILFSIFFYFKKCEVHDDFIQIFYPVRIIKKHLTISPLKIKRITLCNRDMGSTYSNIGILATKFPFYFEFRFDSEEIYKMDELIHIVNNFKVINKNIKIKVVN